MDLNQRGEERVYFGLQLTVHRWGKPRQEESRDCGGTPLSGWVHYPFSTPRPTCLGMAPPAVGLALRHKSQSRKCPIDIPTGQFDGGTTPQLRLPLLGNPSLCQADKKEEEEEEEEDSYSSRLLYMPFSRASTPSSTSLHQLHFI